MEIKFNKAGRWAEPNDASAPQIDVKVGQVCDVSEEMAKIAIDCGQAVSVTNKSLAKKDKAKSERNPSRIDKVKAERNIARGDKARAQDNDPA